MNLNSAQQAATEYLNGPLLVLAGPGTGKTQLLSAKVAYILENTDAAPENILCVTFTESGCTNMRERLASMIGAIAASKVNIHTYHAFGSDLLFQYKNYSETFDRNLDSPIDEVTAYKIVRNIQKSLPATDILKGDRIEDIIETISSAKSARLSATDLAAIASLNIDDSQILSDQISPFLENLVPRKFEENLEKVYSPIFEILKNFQHTPKILKNVDRIINSIATDLESALDEANALQKITPLSAWKDNYFEKTEKNTYRLKDRVANKKLASLANIMSVYDQHLRDNGLFDFDDMIEEAIKALKSDTGFRLTLSERYQFILLDEFQDTNPSQFEIIKLLTDYENPCVMAVGDDDQAIYEFQGASASNLADFKNHYQAKVINLTTNYRSTQDILDFSKQIIAQVPDSFAKTEPNIEKKLTAFFDKSGTIERHEFISSDSEYYWLAEKISSLLKSGTKEKDIAIITPKYKYITPLLPYLKKANINISYDRRENVFEDPKIHTLLVLARFIFELSEGRRPSRFLPEILAFPFWELSPLSVIEAISAAREDKKSGLESLKNSPDQKLKNLAEFFAALSLKSFDTPLETFFNFLLGTTPVNDFSSPFLDFYSKNSTDFELFSLYENLSTLRSALKSHFKSVSSPRLKNLIELIDDYEAAGKPLNNSSPYQDSKNSVQILSAHKAKGLEFENVFLIAADHIAWGKGKGNNNLLSLPKNLLSIRHTGTTDSERIRLLFVAITRARTNLFISNSLTDFDGKSPARLEYLNESQSGDDIISPFIPQKSMQIVQKHYDDLDAAKKCTDLSISWLDVYKSLAPDIRSVFATRVQNFRLSASSLTSFIDIVHAGPKEFFRRHVLHVPPDPETESLAFGNLIHRTFEKITKEKISDESALEFFRDEAKKEDIDPEILTQILEKGPKNLEIALQTFGTNLRAPFTRAEVDLSRERLSFSGVPLTGKIDHLRIDEDQKTIEIFDFKTGSYKKEKWGGSSDVLFKYALQLNFYKLLLNLSPTFKKYRVTTAHILFVTPDKDNEVHDKVYTFNDADEKLLKSLIPTVYTHMQSLDFLDNPSLCPEPDNRKTLKDIKAFLDLL